MRCPWCHNRELVIGRTPNLSGMEEGLEYARKRRPVLGGIVLSGGEPCLREDLPQIISEIKKIPLSIKLDTNGMFPLMLEALFSREETRPDYIALDLKLAPARYYELFPAEAEYMDPGEELKKSASLIRESGITHEYRTIALPFFRRSDLEPSKDGYVTGEDIEALSPLADSSPWYFRPFTGGNCLDSAWNGLQEPPEEALARAKKLAKRAMELEKNAIVP